MHRLRTDDLDYPLDPACVATVPAEPRDSARMMIVHRDGGEVVHARVRDLPGWLRAGDLMVANHTKVAPVRFEGVRVADARPFEGLFVAPVGDCGQATGSSFTARRASVRRSSPVSVRTSRG
jgi:S-adenosylmethionine:tRNA ribosyltransferase-isomerase